MVEKPASKAPVLMVSSASPHIARVVRGLCDAGQPVVLATHGPLALDVHSSLLESVVVDLSVRHWRAASQLRELMLRWSPAVVHAQQANSVGWHAARAVQGSGVPLVLTLWGSDVLLLPQRSLLHRWMVRRALNGAQAWTADAQVVLEAARQVAGPASASLLKEWIPLGVDDSFFASTAGAEVPRERRILSCRLHKPLYRIDAVIRAFAQLPAAGSEWILEVAASGAQTGELKALARQLNVAHRVEFSGFLSADELRRSYQRAAVFVSVPMSDGSAVSLLEAMAAGCVPVVSDLPANREWVTDGINGLLVADVARLDVTLAEALARSASPAWAAGPGVDNRALIRRTASFSRNIAQFQELYERIRAITHAHTHAHAR